MSEIVNLPRLKTLPPLFLSHAMPPAPPVKREIRPGEYYETTRRIMGDKFDKPVTAQNLKNLRGLLSASLRQGVKSKKQFFSTYASLAEFMDHHQLARSCFCCFQDCPHYILGFGDFRTAKRHIFLHCQELLEQRGILEERELRIFYEKSSVWCEECSKVCFMRCRVHHRKGLREEDDGDDEERKETRKRSFDDITESIISRKSSQKSLSDSPSSLISFEEFDNSFTEFLVPFSDNFSSSMLDWSYGEDFHAGAMAKEGFIEPSMMSFGESIAYVGELDQALGVEWRS